MRDIVGLYLDPPDRAVVLCVDETSQIQALDRTQLLLPMRPGKPSGAHTTTSGMEIDLARAPDRFTGWSTVADEVREPAPLATRAVYARDGGLRLPARRVPMGLVERERSVMPMNFPNATTSDIAVAAFLMVDALYRELIDAGALSAQDAARIIERAASAAEGKSHGEGAAQLMRSLPYAQRSADGR